MNEVTACPAKIPQVAEQVQRLEGAIAQMSGVQSEMEERLSGILQSPSPSGAGSPKDKPALVPLADELDRLNAQLRSLIMGFENMMSRVEV